jgi:hypothetical protein
MEMEHLLRSQSEGLPPRPVIGRGSTSLSNLLQAFPAGGKAHLADKTFMSGLPRDSLLQRNEATQTAHKINMLNRRASSNALQRPLLEVSAPSQPSRQASGGFRGGMYNDGVGGAMLAPTSGAGQGMMYGMQSYPSGNGGYTMQQGQMMMAYQNMHGGAANGYPQMMQDMGGYMATGSTPNLLGDPGYGQLQRHSSMMTLGQTQGQLMAETFLDPKSKARIDAWRQGIQ